MDTQLSVERKIVIFVSQPSYEPAQHLIALLQAANSFRVILVDKFDGDQSDFKDSYTVVIFVTPADFPNGT